MALQLQKESKGITAEYWKIIASTYSAVGNVTNLTLALYVSHDTRLAGINNFLETQTFQFEGFLTQAEMYGKIKESRKVKNIITPAVTEGTMPDITIITPEVSEMVETNTFAAAVDC